MELKGEKKKRIESSATEFFAIETKDHFVIPSFRLMTQRSKNSLHKFIITSVAFFGKCIFHDLSVP